MSTLKHTTTAAKPQWESKIAMSVAGIVVFVGAFYLYTTNRLAVQGFAIRNVEKEIATLKQDNNQLRIQEAELKSLYRIEETGRRLKMFEPTDVSYLENTHPIALR